MESFYKLGDVRWQAICLTGIGVLHFQAEEMEAGLDSLSLAIKLLESKGLEKDLRIPLNNIGSYLLDMKKPEEAIPYLQKSLELDKKYNKQSGQILTLANLGLAYEDLKQYDLALPYFEEALRLAESFQLRQIKSAVYKDLSEFYEVQGETKSALDYFQKYHWLEDSLLNEEIGRQVAELSVVHRTEQTQRELEDLKDLIQALRSSKLINQVLNILFLITGLILALIVYLWYSRNRAWKKLVELEFQNQVKQSALLEKELLASKQDLTNFALDIARKNAFSNKVLESIKQIIDTPPDQSRKKARELLAATSNHLQINEDIRQFQENVEQVNQEFFQRLIDQFPGMTSGERHLCGLIRLNLSNKEISVIRNVSTKTIEMARYRLRKKLELEQNMDLNAFIQSF
ncbi:MAG: tetratricopeptide repeat protein [Saprospiraceae bacterium]|nr:tetratricopeptide repeat protein [Saprospiraceae bacterium]